MDVIKSIGSQGCDHGVTVSSIAIPPLAQSSDGNQNGSSEKNNPEEISSLFEPIRTDEDLHVKGTDPAPSNDIDPFENYQADDDENREADWNQDDLIEPDDVSYDELDDLKGCARIRDEVDALVVAEQGGEASDSDPFADLTLHADAFHGIAGEFTRVATRESEADPAAVLATLLVRCSVEFGHGPHFMVGDTRHTSNLFVAIVGSTAKARKGTSSGAVDRVFSGLDALYYQPARKSPGPLSTGEGLINEVKDDPNDPNKDKRLYIQSSEFGSALQAAARSGNTVSTILRCLWDDGNAAPITKSNKIAVTNGHIGIVTHITTTELREAFPPRELSSGLANRFLWVVSKKQKPVAIPPSMDINVLANFQQKFVDIFTSMANVTQLTLSNKAQARYIAEYNENLYPDVVGRWGEVIARSEAQVTRLAMVYALLDQSSVISLQHLKAALALWNYCKASAKYIFDNGKLVANNPMVEKILEALSTGDKTKTQIQALFGNHGAQKDIERALEDLFVGDKIESIKDKSTGGRPKTHYRLKVNESASTASALDSSKTTNKILPLNSILL